MSLFRAKITVNAHERAAEYVDGSLTRVLAPGRYRQPRRATYVRVHVLENIQQLAAQDVLTSDGVLVRISVALRAAVSDVERFLAVTHDPHGVVYLAVQVALRDALLDVPVEEAVRAVRRDLGAALTEAARRAAEQVGLDVREVVVKDVILPGDLRAAYADLVSARTRGQAQLEAARAETAALRSLANGAKLLDEHPALARLRVVQALPPGSTVELGRD
jgi:regulator of protease activity HflC (stomatin/prohibitin superfamily)